MTKLMCFSQCRKNYRNNHKKNNMAHRKHLVVMSLLFVLVSCIHTPQQLDSIRGATSAPFVLATPVISVSATEPRTDTPNVKPTPTPFPISTETPISKWLSDEIPSCTNGENPSSIDDLEEMNGVILYTNKERINWYALVGSPPKEETVLFPEIRHEIIAFSPNRQWAISYDYHPDQAELDHANLQLIGSDGQSQNIELDLSEMGHYFEVKLGHSIAFQNLFVSWVNDQMIMVGASYSETPENAFPLYQFALYHVFQQTWWDELVNEIPDREPYAWLNVSPDLKRVLYQTAEGKMALWDRDQKKVVFTKPHGASTGETVFISGWSSDSRLVTFEYFPDLIILTKEGKVLRTIKEIFKPEVNKFQKEVRYQWSPDSQRLAIMISSVTEGEVTWKSTLVIYNIAADQVLYNCSIDTADDNVSQLLWSPDGKQVLSRTGRTGSSSFYIFDLLGSSVYHYKKLEIADLFWFMKYPLNLK